MTLNDDFEIVEPDLADAELRRIEFAADRILLAFALAGGSESFVLEVVEPLWLNCSTDFPQNVVDRVAIFEDLRAVEEALPEDVRELLQIRLQEPKSRRSKSALKVVQIYPVEGIEMICIARDVREA
jgi:hypothetical protein